MRRHVSLRPHTVRPERRVRVPRPSRCSRLAVVKYVEPRAAVVINVWVLDRVREDKAREGPKRRQAQLTQYRK